MTYEVNRAPVSPLQLAAVRDLATMHDLVRKIERHVGHVIACLNEAGVKFSRCVIVYWDDDGETSLIESADGVPVDVGWEVAQPFADPKAGIATVQTPSGTAATTIHIGPYYELYKAHNAVREWCKENGAKRVGAHWEVYDHPREGVPTRTDVFYLIE